MASPKVCDSWMLLKCIQNAIFASGQKGIQVMKAEEDEHDLRLLRPGDREHNNI